MFELPLIRKLISVGKTSKAVILPKSWLKCCEEKAGHQIKSLAIEVNEVLTIKPVFTEGKR